MKKIMILFLLSVAGVAQAMNEKEFNALLQQRLQKSDVEEKDYFNSVDVNNVLQRIENLNIGHVPHFMKYFESKLIEFENNTTISKSPHAFYDADIENALQKLHETGKIDSRERSKRRQDLLESSEINKNIFKKKLLLLELINTLEHTVYLTQVHEQLKNNYVNQLRDELSKRK